MSNFLVSAGKIATPLFRGGSAKAVRSLESSLDKVPFVVSGGKQWVDPDAELSVKDVASALKSTSKFKSSSEETLTRIATLRSRGPVGIPLFGSEHSLRYTFDTRKAYSASGAVDPRLAVFSADGRSFVLGPAKAMELSAFREAVAKTQDSLKFAVAPSKATPFAEASRKEGVSRIRSIFEKLTGKAPATVEKDFERILNNKQIPEAVKERARKFAAIAHKVSTADQKTPSYSSIKELMAIIKPQNWAAQPPSLWLLALDSYINDVAARLRATSDYQLEDGTDEHDVAELTVLLDRLATGEVGIYDALGSNGPVFDVTVPRKPNVFRAADGGKPTVEEAGKVSAVPTTTINGRVGLSLSPSAASGGSASAAEVAWSKHVLKTAGAFYLPKVQAKAAKMSAERKSDLEEKIARFSALLQQA